VTGFVKTLHVCTRIEIHFIVYCNSHTCELSRHNNKTGIDKQVCFYRQPVFDLVKSWRTIINPVRPLRGINRVAWVLILSHCTSARFVVWSGLLWPSVWPTVHTAWSPVSKGIANPPTHSFICSTCDIAGCFQNVSICQCNDSYYSTVVLVQILCGYYQHK